MFVESCFLLPTEALEAYVAVTEEMRRYLPFTAFERAIAKEIPFFEFLGQSFEVEVADVALNRLKTLRKK